MPFPYLNAQIWIPIEKGLIYREQIAHSEKNKSAEKQTSESDEKWSREKYMDDFKYDTGQ